MVWDHDESHCPLEAVDRRLRDVHYFWLQANRAYFDPDQFRLSIQAAIQTARQVTFLLQKHKDIIPNFENWYEKGWRIKLAADPLMKWMVEARNRIEKQGDLEAHSFVCAEVMASYLDEGPKIQVPANLWHGPAELVKSIPDSLMGLHIKKNGILKIRRRWIENTLPELELLDAVAIAYGKLAQLVSDAHVHMGLPDLVDTGEQYSKNNCEGRLPCMIGHEDARTLNIWLATGKPLEFETIHTEINHSVIADPTTKYGINLKKIFAKRDKTQDYARSIFAAARKIFEKDGYHSTIAILLRQCRPIGFQELRPVEHGHKYMIMRLLAQEAQKIGADAVILISESWMTSVNPSKLYMCAADSPNREEFLTATAISKKAPPLMLQARILRSGKKARLGQTHEEIGGIHFAFAPLYKIWRTPL